MFALHCTAPIKILYGLIRFAQHCTAPYEDILWFNKDLPTLHSSL